MIVNGTEKSALLLMSIGSDQASEVLKYLTPFEVQKLVNHMVNINHFSNIELNKVLAECYDLFMKNNDLVYNNNDEYISDMLIKSIGEKKGTILLSDALEIRNIKMSIKSLNSMEPSKLASLLEEQHAQIITTILVYLDPDQSARVLSFFKEEKRIEIVIKISEFNGLEEKKFVELKDIINDLINKKKSTFSNKGGIKTVANILSSMERENEKNLLKKIACSNKELSSKIIQELYSFENIINIDDNVMKCLIKNLEEEKLYIALQGSNEIIKNKFLNNMDEEKSKKLSLYLKEKSYVSNAAIENEQKLIVMMIRNILDYGTFSIENLGKYYV
ncbi:flagellar motor switch protein FliG [Buchnera aphidicola (Aphis glycines)]|uniref:Flagellar motor switch protein FliG n=1 Tax=Buchnera aphidicola (Aphis glycines) TaxID=1265350 RepID=A0A0M4HI40_9GAMM|nr:flagellar motor switch protein FliG [Buchnera aphidicola]ALD15039.1 flagellar motor switch protein FliG [Buchnera aphidicola (Aphis glycines)]